MKQTLTFSQDLDRYTLPTHGLEDAAGEPSLLQHAKGGIANSIDRFNSDVRFALTSLASQIAASGRRLVGATEIALPAHAKALLDRFTVLDALAIYYRDKTRRTFISLLWLAVFAMILLEGFAHGIFQLEVLLGEGNQLHLGASRDVLSWLPVFFALYPIVWFGAYFVWRRAHLREYQRKHQDYRALAEGLRVQLFWSLLGLPDAVEKYYLRKQRGELEWIRHALRSWRSYDEKTLGSCPLSPRQLKDHKDLVRERWVKAQAEYFANVAGPREQKEAEKCKHWSAVLFGTSLVTALALWVLSWPLVHSWCEKSLGRSGVKLTEECMIFVISILLVGAAVWIAFGEKMAFAEHMRQYRATSICFQEVDKALSNGDLTASDIELLRDLGKEALAENGDWLLLHRDRPLEVIVP